MSAVYSPESQPWFEPLRQYLEVEPNDETFCAVLLVIQRWKNRFTSPTLIFPGHTQDFVRMAERAQVFFRDHPELGVR